MKVLIIDNFDSFTFNLHHYVSEFTDNCDVIRNDKLEDVNFDKYNKIILSPGPSLPKDHSTIFKFLSDFAEKKSILGICLGFQQILFNENGKIIQQKKIYHGFQSKIKVLSNSKLFKKNKYFTVGRYHSLKLNEPYKSKDINITMRCILSNAAMAIEDHKNKIFGFQFHPESFLTKNGKYLIQKIISA